MKATARELIKTIHINTSNLDYIGETGNINGTLLLEIERVMKTYATQRVKAALEEAAEWAKVTYTEHPTDGFEFFVDKKSILSLIPSDKKPCDCKKTCDELTEEGEKVYTCNGLPEF